MRLQLPELQDNNEEAKALISDVTGFLEGWNDDMKVLQYQGLLYILRIIRFKVISHHNNDLLIRYFRINKIWKLVVRMYY